ncbi:MAG: polyhydroxyalkanoate synthesis repressor PhaR [Pseudomonadota bacterium]
MARKSADAAMNVSEDTIVIKKYANRRLYNTASSSYITLEDLAKMVRENVEFAVFDAKSGEDITHSILTQIIMDEEANGEQMLPVSFLRQLISMYGNSMQNLMPSYLEATMTNFRERQGEIREAFEKGMQNNPISAIHETNMAMMRAAAETFIPGVSSKNSAKKSDASPTESSSDEIAALREQMAAMQKKLDELGK